MKRIHIQIPFNGTLRIKNKTLLQWLVIIVAFWSVIFKPVSALPGPLSYLKYLPDGILLLMMVLTTGKAKVTIQRAVVPVFRIVALFVTYCLLIYLFRYQSIAYFIWGFRNNFRFYVAFFLFISYLNKSDVVNWFKTMDVLFWVNALLSVLQFLILGIKGDFLGGIFGIRGASNGFTLCFMSILIGKTLLETFNGHETIEKSMAKCIAAILIATMAEMKFFFFVMIFLLIGATLLTHASVKKMFYLMFVLVALMIGAVWLVEWFGFEGFFSLSSLLETATQRHYTSSRDLNRLSAIPVLSSSILKNPLQRVFGLGLGNCDTSAFAICNTPFFKTYGYLHYNWFASAMLFLETGFLGLGLYMGFFVICFWYALKQLMAQKGNTLYNQLSILISILCIVLMFYDFSIRAEPGYMMYFVLALPFIR